MLTVSIPKLLQEAHAIKEALEQMSEGVPAGISASEMSDRIAALEGIISELDKVNAQKTQLVNSKGDMAQRVNDYIVQVRAVVKGMLGADSSEYEMVGGTRASERKKAKRKEKATA
jgi:predicted ATP-grasp superfamily ATP-dependent carboligase